MRICQKTLAQQRRARYNLYEKYNFSYKSELWRTVMADNKQGKYIFGTVKVGEKGQIVIPRDARKVFDIKPGDSLLVLGDTAQGGLALVKSEIMMDFINSVMSAKDVTEE